MQCCRKQSELQACMMRHEPFTTVFRAVPAALVKMLNTLADKLQALRLHSLCVTACGLFEPT